MLSIQVVGPDFSLLNLLVQNIVLLILDGAELPDLLINQTLTNGLLLHEPFLFGLLLHEVTGSLFLCKFLDAFLVAKLSALGLLLLAHLLLVGLNQVLFNLLGPFFDTQLTHLFALEIILSLSLDQLSFEHL